MGGTEGDLKGNPIINQSFELAEKLYDKGNYTRKPRAGPLQKTRIDHRLRNIKVEVIPHSVCKLAVLKVTAY